MNLYRHFGVILLAVLTAGLIQAKAQGFSAAQSESVQAFFVPKGTPVKLRVIQPISSETATTGDRVSLEVTEDVKVGSIVVVPKGSKAEGFVSEVMPARIWGYGSLSIYVSWVRTRAGFDLPVHAVLSIDANAVSGQTDGAVISKDTPIIAKTELDIPLDKAAYLPATPAG